MPLCSVSTADLFAYGSTFNDYTRLELCVGMICGSIPVLRPLLTEWRKRGSKGPGYHCRTRSAMKPDLYVHQVQKTVFAPNAPSIPKATRPFEQSTSEERMVKPEDERRILKTQDIEISFQNATSAVKPSRMQYDGCGAV